MFIIVENDLKVVQKGINTLKMAQEMRTILKEQSPLLDYQIFKSCDKMKINKDIVFKIAMETPHGEKRTPKEVLNAIKDETNEEHDYFKDLYNELKGGLIEMEFNLNDMCDWERKKAVFLMGLAEELGISLKDYGQVAVNNTSGYTYLWSENYNFSLYMPINCELKKTDVYALWSCSECGEEDETSLKDGDTLADIEARINDIEQEHYKDRHTDKLAH